MNWYQAVLKKYATITGRAQRTEYWMFMLVNFLITLALELADMIVAGGILTVLYWLAMVTPSWSVSVRRLHDTGRSGWWLLIGLVPLVGAIVLLVFYCQDSTPGANEYGPNPKGA
jgi:uncharacterized membrane protein YhaH (DUF805 family)